MSGPQSVPLAELTDQEKFTALVKAAKTYDHDNRPRGQSWTGVSDNQAGRLILGALSAMDFAQPARSLDGLMPMGLHFDDADPVARCLVKDCRWHGHGDSMTDAVTAWVKHLGADHRLDWPED